MSTLIAENVVIDEIMEHPNADRLEIAVVKGWNCIVRKGEFKKGDFAFYIPIDTLMPQALEEKIFPPDSKIKLSKHRVKSIKIRGSISQGLLVDCGLVGTQYEGLGKNLADKLGLKKYEPSDFSIPSSNIGRGSRKQPNPLFNKYTDIENYKNYPNVFKEGDEVQITEKVHGTSARYGLLPYHSNSKLNKLLYNVKNVLLTLIGREKTMQYVYGSRNVQLQGRLRYKGFYPNNVYYEIFEKYNLKEILEPNMIIYGEIYGWGVQKGYTYGCLPDQRKFVVYDIKKNGKYMSVPIYRTFCAAHGLPTVRELYRGKWNFNIAKKYSMGDSVMAPEQKMIEGIVIKSLQEEKVHMGRKILKLINDEYLLKKGQ